MNGSVIFANHPAVYFLIVLIPFTHPWKLLSIQFHQLLLYACISTNSKMRRFAWWKIGVAAVKMCSVCVCICMRQIKAVIGMVLWESQLYTRLSRYDNKHIHAHLLAKALYLLSSLALSLSLPVALISDRLVEKHSYRSNNRKKTHDFNKAKVSV